MYMYISLHKGKVNKDICDNFRRILVHSGKVFTRLLLKILMAHICPRIVPESQCGFRVGRSTVDMMFTALHAKEKYRGHRVDHIQVFIYLTKLSLLFSRCISQLSYLLLLKIVILAFTSSIEPLESFLI